MKAIMCGIVLACLQSLSAQGGVVKDLLVKAKALDGEAYWKARNEIVEMGTEIVPELAKIQEDKTLDWKLLLMAGICREWIERKVDIQAMETKDWKSDPDYDPKWTGFRPGPWFKLRYLVIKRYQEQRLWFYCLEAMWKGLEKFPHIWKAEKGNWEWACEEAVEDSPMREWAIRILEDRVENDPTFKSKLSEGSFRHLIDLKSTKSLPVLLKAWKAQGNMHDEFVVKIMNLAGPEDADILEEFAKDPNVKFSRSEGMFRENIKNLKAARDAKRLKDAPPDQKDK